MDWVLLIGRICMIVKGILYKTDQFDELAPNKVFIFTVSFQLVWNCK